MSFLRDNLFTVILVGGTAVLCLGLLGWGHGISGQIEDEHAEREGLSRRILNLSGGNKVNIGTINSEQTRVRGILQSLLEVRKRNVEWNSRNFKVPDLPLLLNPGQTQAALPFDSTIWHENSLAFYFVRQYHAQLDELLGRLKPTSPPTGEEIDAEIIQQKAYLKHLELIREKRALRTGGEGEANVQNRSADAGPVGGNIVEEARLRAKDSLKLRKAGDGLIYANASSFDNAFIRGKLPTELKSEEVWRALVGFWVQKDIVAVLGKTIKQVQDRGKLPKDDRNVINSPIKRLVEIRISGETSTGSRNERAGKRAPVRPASWSMGPTPGIQPRKRIIQRRVSQPQLDRPDTLTQNIANPVFDVVNYSFTVVMPTRFLPLLEENLMKQNYHVILNVQISRVAEDNQTQADELYYYSADPVRKVTIEAQLLLLADWTRGQWDAKDKKWLHFPLMPLEEMQILSPGALRNEDRKLIDKKLPMPWKASAGREGSNI